MPEWLTKYWWIGVVILVVVGAAVGVYFLVSGTTVTDPVVLKKTIGAMPTINLAGSANPDTLDADSLERTNPVADQAVSYNEIQSAFALECYWDLDTDNACPPAITAAIRAGTIPEYQGPNSTAEAPYWYSNFSIPGITHHAEAYLNECYNKALTATTIDHDSIQWVATKNFDGTALAAEADASKYIINIPGAFNRYQAGTGSDAGLHFVFDGVSTRRKVSVPWAKFLDSQGSPRNTGGAQMYLSLDAAGGQRILAVNQVMNYTEPSGFRHMFMVNLETNAILYKYGMRSGENTNTGVVAGTGGFDYTTSTWKAGRYFARCYVNGVVDYEAAINSKTQTEISAAIADVDNEQVQGFFTGGKYTASVFLDLNDDEVTDLTPWIDAFFADAEPIPLTQIPTGPDDAANFPDEVRSYYIMQN